MKKGRLENTYFINVLSISKYDEIPRAIKYPKDIMPKMTTCPKSHFVQGDKLSLRRYHLCLSLQNAYKFGQKLANFGQFSSSDPSLFFGNQKAHNFTQNLPENTNGGFYARKSPPGIWANFHLGHKIFRQNVFFGKLSYWA